MKKLILIFCIFALCACSSNDDTNSNLYETYLGYRDEDEREELIREKETTIRKTGYSLDNSGSYLLGDMEALTISILPGKVYTRTIGQIYKI